MPKHKPIKFESTLETTTTKEVLRIIKENKTAKTTLNATLALIAVGGVLTLGAAMPGAFSIFSNAAKNHKKRQYEEYQTIWQNFYKLKKRDDIKFTKEKDGYLIYRLTKKGKKKIKKLLLNEMKLQKPKKWDGKWRLVIFDIPETQKNTRDALRRKLEQLDFYQCQKSTWIHPFACLEEIEFLKNFFSIKPFVKLFLVEEMTDGKVLYHFKDLLKESI
ncbi:hypothetical protein KKA27_02475 [Patescibacteria group bacterium]|nr:hypothetical protein [Patescibacteria group bacterium]